MATAEAIRLAEERQRRKNWKRWGTYLPERQWGTVREDYSADGNSWAYFPFSQAQSRVYRWAEDGLLGFCDRQCRLCFAPVLWNGADPILKERLFGLDNAEGNHGEDCKELYYYLDATPTYSYAKALYKYPQRPFPYADLLARNRERDTFQPEYELLDTGIFADNRYFDILVEYAKAGPDDILIRLRAINRGPETAILHLLGMLWFRNTWIWGCKHEGCTLKPRIEQVADNRVCTAHETLEPFAFVASAAAGQGQPQFLFTENESNSMLLWGTPGYTPYTKDAFQRFLVQGDAAAICPDGHGTRVGAWHQAALEAGEEITIHFRLFRAAEDPGGDLLGPDFERIVAQRQAEADAFYADLGHAELSVAETAVQRQAYAGLLWSKKFYHYSVSDWLAGDPQVGPVPSGRALGRNSGWSHLFNRDVVSVPDAWEYPWYAAWDLAFHVIPFARLDSGFAKDQLMLFLREWYMHPNGQIPAYEWALSDVNPPVHAWACWRVYQESGAPGARDRDFLERAFHKLLINFTWWVNRKDPHGRNLFSGGFLGLDNIGVFDRSKPLPGGGELTQADGTAWMAFYCLTMLVIAIELAHDNAAYEDVASKFFEHFVQIADAMNSLGGRGLWDEQDGFYYDELVRDGVAVPLKVRSMVGIIPLFAVQALHWDEIDRLPGFRRRMEWFLRHRSDLSRQIAWMQDSADASDHVLLAIPSRERLQRVLSLLFSESEFLSPWGIRSLSKHHQREPYAFHNGDGRWEVRYSPGDSETFLFGGNSNWRGPIWFPLNYLLIEALERYHHFYGDRFLVEYPSGSGCRLTLRQIACDLRARLVSLFLPDALGRRPCHGDESRYGTDPCFRELILFHEFFHGENGKGLGASHQTGWTALVATLIEQLREADSSPRGGVS